MPVPLGSQIDTEGTRAKILDTATKLLYRRGLEAVGMNELARSAGVSKLTIYRYFGSKDGLVRAMVDARSDRVHDWLQSELSEIPEGRERLLALFDLLCGWYREEGFRGCAVVNAVSDARARPGFLADLADRHLARYRELLVRNLQAAGVTDAGDVATQLLVLIEGATVLSAVNEGAANDRQAGIAARRAAELLVDAAGSRTRSATAG